MGDILWIFAVIILSVSETWSLAPGTNQSIFDNSSTTPDPKVDVVINLTFNLGADVNLTCSDKKWNGTMYVIWKIQKSNCEIGFINPGNGTDSCHDGKSLKNTNSSQPYLHIPNFSTYDSGVYKCEWVYSGGIENYVINVAIRVPPTVSIKLDKIDKKMMAVCTAERGKPAANISWSYPGNQFVKTTVDTEGFSTVLSYFEIPKGMDLKNLSCIVTHHNWSHEVILGELPIRGKNFLWLYITICVVIVFLGGIVFIAQKKLVILRQCGQSDTSSAKSTPTEDVEEVEPYASYVQRVNSIYNSSADFCSKKNPAHASHAHP
ncbi:Cell surface glycoprotein CD200 receptor 1-A [Channa argus]|uniref:Cell surface glycoprotein CD200 receptor 1-A n=1 Tax=Channa argus TaxID=215402 RepID=A0A6G1PWZ4_CHAAH|nr:Cell surface glycoprotein CD200 receptor 1-A [Channa argus]